MLRPPGSCSGSERGSATGCTGGDRGFGEGTDADRRASDCKGWRTGERSRDCDCGPRPPTGRAGSVSEFQGEPAADQHEPGVGVGAGQHRTDDSRGSDGLDYAAQTIDSRVGAERGCPAFRDAHFEPVDIRHGADDDIAGDCPSGDFCGIFVLGSGAVECGRGLFLW